MGVEPDGHAVVAQVDAAVVVGEVVQGGDRLDEPAAERQRAGTEAGTRSFDHPPVLEALCLVELTRGDRLGHAGVEAPVGCQSTGGSSPTRPSTASRSRSAWPV